MIGRNRNLNARLGTQDVVSLLICTSVGSTLKWANDTDTEGLNQSSSVKPPADLHSCKCYVDYFRTPL